MLDVEMDTTKNLDNVIYGDTDTVYLNGPIVDMDYIDNELSISQAYMFAASL